MKEELIEKLEEVRTILIDDNWSVNSGIVIPTIDKAIEILIKTNNNQRINKSKQIIGRGYRTEIIIDIYNINVDEKYFSFNYMVWINSDTEPIVDSYSSNHVHRTEEEQEKFKTLIQESFGHQLALEKIINENLWS